MNVDTLPIEPVELWLELERAGDVPAAREEALLAARAALRRAATTETLRVDVLKARRRRVRIAVLVAGAVAASIAVGAVRLNLGGHEVGASPAAAVVLERAAKATLAQSDPVVGPGQYLRIRLVEQGWGTTSGADREILHGDDGRLVVHQERRTRTIWVPHDLSDDWIFRDGTEVLRSNSADPRYQYPAEPTRTWAQPGWSDPDGRTYIKTYDPAWYATLPRDPEQLLDRLTSESNAEGSGLAYWFQEVYSEVLRSGIAPADIRAALFEGLADTPGMKVQDDVTTLDGRSGVAIGARGSTWQMVFDQATGRYIGERATDPDFPDVPGVDADKTTWLTSVTTEVVDHAPTAKGSPGS
jgi:hypothetical protein